MMKAGDLKNALMQLNNDDMVVFNFISLCRYRYN